MYEDVRGATGANADDPGDSPGGVSGLGNWSAYPAGYGGGLVELGSPEVLGKLYAALGRAQAAFLPIVRSKTVRIDSRERASYSYDYAPLEDLLGATRKALSDNGLVILTPIYRHEGEAQVLVICAHEAGGRIMVPFGFLPSTEIKGLGAQITYLRRYGYSALLNLTADADAEDHPSDAAPHEKATTRPRAPRAIHPATNENIPYNPHSTTDTPTEPDGLEGKLPDEKQLQWYREHLAIAGQRGVDLAGFEIDEKTTWGQLYSLSLRLDKAIMSKIEEKAH